MADSLREYRQKRDFPKTARAERRGRPPHGGWPPLPHPEARRDAAAFRFPPRARRRAPELGGDPRAEPRPDGQAARGPHRGPSARLRRLRGHDPEGRVWRRHRHAVGRGHLGAGRRSRGGARQGRLQVHPPRRAAEGQVGAGPHASRKPGERSKRENWLLIKERDEYAGRGEEADHRAGADQRVAPAARWRRSPPATSNGSKPAARFKEGRPPQAGEGQSAPPQGPREGAPPKFVAPQLATLVEAPPEGDDWVHEIKYRRLPHARRGRRRRGQRSTPARGLDWTDKFRSLVRPLADLPLSSALIDGEVAVTDEDGRTDFGALQDAIAEGKGRGIVYYVFDLLFARRRGSPQAAARSSGRRSSPRCSPTSRGPDRCSIPTMSSATAPRCFERACAMNLEGIVSKRADAPYRSERTKAWLKVEVRHRARSSSSSAGSHRT